MLAGRVHKIIPAYLEYFQWNCPPVNDQELTDNNELTHWGRDKMADIFADNLFKCIFLNENVWNSIKISLKFVPKGPNNNIPALFR